MKAAACKASLLTVSTRLMDWLPSYTIEPWLVNFILKKAYLVSGEQQSHPHSASLSFLCLPLL